MDQTYFHDNTEIFTFLNHVYTCTDSAKTVVSKTACTSAFIKAEAPKVIITFFIAMQSQGKKKVSLKKVFDEVVKNKTKLIKS